MLHFHYLPPIDSSNILQYLSRTLKKHAWLPEILQYITRSPAFCIINT